MSHVGLLLILLPFLPALSLPTVSPPQRRVFVDIAVLLALVVGVVFWVPRLRKRTLVVIKPILDAIPGVIRDPRRSMSMVAAAGTANLAYGLALYGAVAAFGPAAPPLGVVVVYLVAATVASIAPTPGGLGAMEAGVDLGSDVLELPEAEAWPPRSPGVSDCHLLVATRDRRDRPPSTTQEGEGVTRLIAAVGPFAPIVVLVLAAAESAAFVGVVVPGELAVILAGVAAGTGGVSLWLMIPAAVAGAIAGDSIGYSLGHRVGPALLDRPKMARVSKRMDAAAEMLSERGWWALVVANSLRCFGRSFRSRRAWRRRPFFRYSARQRHRRRPVGHDLHHGGLPRRGQLSPSRAMDQNRRSRRRRCCSVGRRHRVGHPVDRSREIATV